ncbi:MAG: pyruvate kinase [Nitrososphaerales archaeon]
MTQLEPGSRADLYRELLAQVSALRSSMLEVEAKTLPRVGAIRPENAESATNLAHYLALRRSDVRALQEKLASVGLSSLGRSEAHVLATVDGVMEILQDLTGEPGPPIAADRAPLSFEAGRAILSRNADALLGPSPRQRTVRIMVTMPTEAARDYALVEDLLSAGMNLMRINCAHDDPETWALMVENLRRAEAKTGRRCRLLMDVPGPKVRTGPMEPGPRVLKVRPRRSQTGEVVAPAVVRLSVGGGVGGPTAPSADATLPLERSAPLLAADPLRPGEELRFRDARGSKRSLVVVAAEGSQVVAELHKTAYFETGATIVRKGTDGEGREPLGTIGEIPSLPTSILLKKGDRLLLARDRSPGRAAVLGSGGEVVSPARVSCTAPEAVASVKPGESVWFDDGKIGGVVREVGQEGALVEITSSLPGGVALGPDKGINLPETELHLPTLSPEDLEALLFIAKNADLVGQSFVRSTQDVLALQSSLREMGADGVGIVLKIETKQAFDCLPSLLFAAMRTRSCGVMIARGDLAVECGWERLAEIQEEILWFCEAAHVPVVWATQVLETLTKTGTPSRAEITDAAFSEGAECVMLNKGPHVVEAVRALDDILGRMQSHMEKKSAMLRRLRVADDLSLA